MVVLACRPAVVTGPEVAANSGREVPMSTAPVAPTTPVAAPADRDADGVADASDGCPGEPEDVDRFEDGDGCVDRDNDRDGVVDAFEWRDGRWTNCDYAIENGAVKDCRNLPEIKDGVADRDGCPERVCMDQCPHRIGRVQHDGRREFIGEWQKGLDEVAALLRLDPDAYIHVDGHTDHLQGDKGAKISERMAEKARDDLVGRGVARERMEVRAFGADVPTENYRTPKGRAANRRVDFTLAGCCGKIEPPPPADDGTRPCV